MSLSMNQKYQTPVKGQLDLRFNGQTVSGVVKSDEAVDLIPGQAVKMVDSASKVPTFTAVTADTDDIYGFVNYNMKNVSFAAGTPVEVSAMRNNVMYMEASAAIARNAKVMVVVTGSKVATATTGKTIAGRAYDKAAADGDLIRVTIDLPGVAD